LSRGTQKLPLSIAGPLYPGDRLKVTKEKCEIRVLLGEKREVLVNMANSPYVVTEVTSPLTSDEHPLLIISEWLNRLWGQQQEYRIMTTTK